MKKALLAQFIWAKEKIAAGNVTDEDIALMSRAIGNFQHERLIHLIVTAFVGICVMLSIIIVFTAMFYLFAILTLILTVLFIFYIAHYYALENNTQKLYGLLEQMYEKRS
jgi:VIT1/CCC1 family predicted Fe2+/Mn2+ transporter